MPNTLALVLNHAKLLNDQQLSSIIEYASSSKRSIFSSIVDLSIFTSEQLLQHISVLHGLPIVAIDPETSFALSNQLLLSKLVIEHQALPISLSNGNLCIVVSDPTNNEIESDFAFASGCSITLSLADEADIQAKIRQLFGTQIEGEHQFHQEISSEELGEFSSQASIEESQQPITQLDNAPVSRFIHQVITDAIRKGASDIHFEPFEKHYQVRIRCDGLLHAAHAPPPALAGRLAARLKILSNLDIAEKRLPQDGRIKLQLGTDKSVDIRLSTMPTLWGEKVVLRILDSSQVSLKLEDLGLNTNQYQNVQQALSRPQGMILVTGPTGSGKTITLYSSLNLLNTQSRNISTAEDPIEINLPGINQLQVEPKIGLHFSTALKAFLRQDPDVVMVGEIRDFETAEIAIKASQTGHLVLSTLHTNSALETILRLKNMGIEGYHIAASLSLIIAQRLVRKLCRTCRVVDNQHYPELPTDRPVIYTHSEQGCPECNGGYRGRTGVFEVLTFNEAIKNAIASDAHAADLKQLTQENQMCSLAESGYDKLIQGITSYQELKRVLYI
ncbi:type IV-A pilus assembly ATPase PilB [Vibrio sp. SCSIO 43136]|uniref:type IV-A pilus assembly ATPase PilB n=1 Tax=Vibrio sp. SCSIO 43136 TaxID=2819101 RepID=UPI0020753FF8|nr:type IV-A pilus assembly ATPase PilB [Vibrio sp. SCSIO 43136]USD64854.1 type IV-A pilus assembly ATPase PilB [Vibrio sp. SCSIO 43136]